MEFQQQQAADEEQRVQEMQALAHASKMRNQSKRFVARNSRRKLKRSVIRLVEKWHRDLTTVPFALLQKLHGLGHC